MCLALVRLYKGYSSISSCNAWLSYPNNWPANIRGALIKNTLKYFLILTFYPQTSTGFNISAAHLSSIVLSVPLRLSYLSQCSLAACLGIPWPYLVRLAQPTTRLVACISRSGGISEEVALFCSCVLREHPGVLLVGSSLPFGVLGTRKLCLWGVSVRKEVSVVFGYLCIRDSDTVGLKFAGNDSGKSKKCTDIKISEPISLKFHFFFFTKFQLHSVSGKFWNCR